MPQPADGLINEILDLFINKKIDKNNELQIELRDKIRKYYGYRYLDEEMKNNLDICVMYGKCENLFKYKCSSEDNDTIEEDKKSKKCVDFCEYNASNPICKNSFCKSNPYELECIEYFCNKNPYDPKCIEFLCKNPNNANCVDVLCKKPENANDANCKQYSKCKTNNSYKEECLKYNCNNTKDPICKCIEENNLKSASNVFDEEIKKFKEDPTKNPIPRPNCLKTLCARDANKNTAECKALPAKLLESKKICCVNSANNCKPVCTDVIKNYYIADCDRPEGPSDNMYTTHCKQYNIDGFANNPNNCDCSIMNTSYGSSMSVIVIVIWVLFIIAFIWIMIYLFKK